MVLTLYVLLHVMSGRNNLSTPVSKKNSLLHMYYYERIYLFLCVCYACIVSAENASRICSNGDIRLRGGEASYEGRVEVCFNGHWGTVCHNRWDKTDAQTVCRILGYGTENLAIPTTTNFFDTPPAEGPVMVNGVDCNGTESTFLDCLSTDPGDHTCSHAQDSGVFCTVWDANFECQTGDIRLAGGTNKTGRVEVCINGKWGTICNYGWDSKEASVICKQLGFDPSSKS